MKKEGYANRAATKEIAVIANAIFNFFLLR